MKYMSEADKQKVHLLADIRLEEIERLNLSREQILDPKSGKVGIKLSEDPFFQYVKSNKLAREILIKPGEEFTPERIVALALRQDVGIDPSGAVNPKVLRNKEDLNYHQIYE